ncbi:MAG TPA: 2-C-methyl-D-erythritol 2,4-cyclodiphosphate synthase [Ktedonobacterales bacterium]|jgi:2-C-methyl-D-erythritol 2,4-cyclodiphosphate synthase
MRVGIGYDVHAFAPAEAGRTLIIGGVTVPHERGLAGHSDADVLLHAVVDALLGAVGLGDIGHYFPSSDSRWKDAASDVFLAHTRAALAQAGWRVENVDATVVAEAPRLAPFVAAMRAHLAAGLGIEPECVNVKAKTTDGLGFAGRGEGVACYAVALVERG